MKQTVGSIFSRKLSLKRNNSNEAKTESEPSTPVQVLGVNQIQSARLKDSNSLDKEEENNIIDTKDILNNNLEEKQRNVENKDNSPLREIQEINSMSES